MLTDMDNGVQTEPLLSDPLDVLGHEWRVLHTVVPSDDGGDRDVLLVGPPGVVAVTERRRPGSTAWVGARSVTIDGRHTVILHNARSHAERWATLLAMAGRPVDVVPVVVLAELDDFNLQHMPSDVHVTTERRLRRWLRSLTVRLEADEVEAIAIAVAPVAR